MTRIEKSVLEGLVDGAEAPHVYRRRAVGSAWVEGGVIRVEYALFFDDLPLEESELFTSFARLSAHGPPSESKVRRWVERHGLPARGKRPRSMPLEGFRDASRYAHDLLRCYLEYRIGEADAIRSRVRAPASPFDREFSEAFSSARRTWKLHVGKGASRETRDAATLLAARAALGEITTGLVSGVMLRVGVERDLTASHAIPDLPTALYLQFFQIVTQARPLRLCEHCDQPFEAHPKHKRFCSPSCRSGGRSKTRP